MGSTLAKHWDEVYTTKSSFGVSWYQPTPTMSLRLIAMAAPESDDPIVDVGAGASFLADELVRLGHTSVVLADISSGGLSLARQRLGDSVAYVVGDVADLDVGPVALWHDRAVFHFLTDPDERDRYRAAMERHVRARGHAVIATFAADGPESCSGLPTQRYSPEALAAAFSPAFELVESGREIHHTPSGSAQPFTYVLLRRDSQP